MKIAIFGLARSGLAAFKYIHQKSLAEVFLINQGAPEIWSCWDEISSLIDRDHCIDQENAQDIFTNVDQIILSPGIPREHNALRLAHENNIPIISEIEFAYSHSDIPVVAITGTNGKTTTTTMVSEILKKAGLKVFMGGNIGIPYSELLLKDEKFDYAIIELSSFQLESIQNFHAHIAMFLNITENHMERYTSLEDYKNAKYRIFNKQTDSDYAIIQKELDEDWIRSQKFYIEALDHFDYSKSKLVGPHNKMNFYCAYKVCEILKVNNLNTLFQDFINEFTGVPLRLQYITNYQGLNIYNDGKSTNDAATVAAVDSFADSSEDLFLALGGQPRSESTSLNESLKGKRITKVFAFGDARELVASALKNQFEVIQFEGLIEVFDYLKTHELSGNFLFSPAFPSFDQYKNYEIRGEHFTKLAIELSK